MEHDDVKHEEGKELQSGASIRRGAIRSALALSAWIFGVFVVGDLIFDRGRLASDRRWLEIVLIAVFTSVVSYVAKVYGGVVLWRGRPEARGFDVLPKAEEKRETE